MKGTYVQDLIRVVADIKQRRCNLSPTGFIAEQGIGSDDYVRIVPADDRAITAVDGSNATVYSTPFFTLDVFRGAVTWYARQERVMLRQTPLRIFRIGDGQDEDYADVHRDYFGCEPAVPLDMGDTLAAEAAFRDTIEYGLAMAAAREASPGTLLLLDGALYAEHPSHAPILDAITDTCRERGLLLAAVTKNAGATWDGKQPLVPAAVKGAATLGIQPPWYLKVKEGYVACLHSSSARGFLVTVPDAYGDEEVSAVCSALSSYAGDGRVVGYPYPLMDAHRYAVIRHDLVRHVRNDIIAGCATQSINYLDYEDILGDYHDELNRY